MIVNVLVFLIGLLIYAGYGWAGLAYLAAAALLSYGTALLAKKAPGLTWVWIVLNAAMLLMLKLQPVTGISLLAPMGISYFTLQIISYNVDVYRGKYEPERNLFRYALFVTDSAPESVPLRPVCNLHSPSVYRSYRALRRHEPGAE